MSYLLEFQPAYFRKDLAGFLSKLHLSFSWSFSRLSQKTAADVGPGVSLNFFSRLSLKIFFGFYFWHFSCKWSPSRAFRTFTRLFFVVVYRIYYRDPPKNSFADFLGIRTLPEISTHPAILSTSNGIPLIIAPADLAGTFQSREITYEISYKEFL